MKSAHLIKGIALAMAILAGMAFGYWGYELYRLGVSSTTSAGGSWADASFWFNGAGPGIGFAVAGVVIILTAINRRLYEEDTDDGDERASGKSSGPRTTKSYGHRTSE